MKTELKNQLITLFKINNITQDYRFGFTKKLICNDLNN